MKARKILFVCATLLAFGTADMQAQGLGGLLKKVKKGVEAVTGTTSSSSSSSSTTTSPLKPTGTDVPIEGGGTIRNPIPNIADIQLVGAYGKSTSTNYGEVSLVFRVKMIANRTSLSFGCNSELPALMIDQDGNTYKTHESAGWYPYDVTEGVYMKIPLKETASFIDVKRTATTIQQLQFGVSASYNDKGLIILKNVPIQWDVEH